MSDNTELMEAANDASNRIAETTTTKLDETMEGNNSKHNQTDNDITMKSEEGKYYQKVTLEEIFFLILVIYHVVV